MSPTTGTVDTTNPQAVSFGSITIPAGNGASAGECRITIPVQGQSGDGQQAAYETVIAGNSVSGNRGGNPVDNGASPARQSITVNGARQPELLSYEFDQTLIVNGQTGIATLTFRNGNGYALTGAALDIDYPSVGAQTLWRHIPSGGAGGSCGFSVTSTSASGISFGGDLPANSDCTLTFPVEALGTGGVFERDVTDTVDRATDFTTDAGLSLAASRTGTVEIESGLESEFNFLPPTASEGEVFGFEFTLRNRTSGTIQITDFVDQQIDDLTGTADAIQLVTDPTLSCSAGGSANRSLTRINSNGGYRSGGAIDLAAGGTCVISGDLTATIDATGDFTTFTNEVEREDFTIAGRAGFETAVAQETQDTVIVGSELRIRISSAPDEVAAGQPIRYFVTVDNFSAVAATDVELVNELPDGMTLLTGDQNGFDTTPLFGGETGCRSGRVVPATSQNGSRQAVTFDFETVPGYQSGTNQLQCTLTFYAQAPTTGTSFTGVTNTIEPGDLTYTRSGGGGPAQNRNGVSTTTDDQTAFATSRAYAPNNADEGETVRLRYTFVSSAFRPLTNLTLTDLLPTDASGGQMRVASIPAVSTTCQGLVIEADGGDDTVTITDGQVPGRANAGTGGNGNCVVELSVTGPAGVYTSTHAASALAPAADGNSAEPVSDISNSATATFTSVLSATTFFDPGDVVAGGTARAILRVSNGGRGALTGLSAVDDLPTDLVVAPGTVPYTTCAGPVAVTVSNGDSRVALSGATLAAGESCDLVLDVLTSDTNTAGYVNSFPVGTITADGGIRVTENVQASLGILTASPLTLTVRTDPSNIAAPGRPSRLILDLIAGDVDLTGVSLTDYFTADGTAGAAPSGMIVADDPRPTTTCSGGRVTAIGGEEQFSFDGVALVAGASCSVEIDVTALQVGTVSEAIPAGAVRSAQGVSNGVAASTSLAVSGSIGVSKGFTPRQIAPGERSRLLIRITNPATSEAEDLALSDTMPAGVTIPTDGLATTSCVGGIVAVTSDTLTLSGGTIPASDGTVAGTCTVSVDVIAGADGTFENVIPAADVTATVSGAPVSPNRDARGTLQASSPITAQIAIGGTTRDAAERGGSGFTTGSEARARSGESRRLTIHIQNPGLAASGVTVSDPLPDGLVLSPSPNPSTTCPDGVVDGPPSARQFALTGATLGSGASCTVSVDVLANTPGIYDDALPAGAVQTAVGGATREASVARLVVLEPPTIALDFDAPVIRPDGLSTFRITLTNDNAAPLDVTSDLPIDLPTTPGAVVFATTPNLSTTCENATGNLRLNGVGQIVLEDGLRLPADGCVIEVDVTGDTEGEHTAVVAAGDLRTNGGDNAEPASTVLSISTQGFITGRIFGDRDPGSDRLADTIFDTAIDRPFVGHTVELHPGADCTGSAVQDTTTDDQGSYRFDDLAAGSYSVCLTTAPTGTTDTGRTIAPGAIGPAGATGAAGTADGAPASASAAIRDIRLDADPNGVAGSADNIFAYQETSSIAGAVFVDADGDGIRNPDEDGLSAVTITLTPRAGGPTITTTTAGDGSFAFTGLDPALYDIAPTNGLAGTIRSSETAGPVPTPGAPGTTAPSLIESLDLPPGVAVQGNLFARRVNDRVISGLVYVDPLDDGQYTVGVDTPLEGERVVLTGTDTNGDPVPSQTLLTQPDGTFTFSGLPAGTFTVTQPDQPTLTENARTTPGTGRGTATARTVVPSAISGIDLSGTQMTATGNLFAEQLIDRTISGTVILDRDDDGTRDGIDTPIEGQTIELTGTLPDGGTVSRSTVTDADGLFAFNELARGTYTLTQPSQAADTDDGQTIPGSAGGTPTAKGTLPSQIADIDLTDRPRDALDNVFFEQPIDRRILGTLLLDRDDDGGAQDANDDALPGLTVRLEGLDFAGDPVTAQTQSTSDGTFAFGDLPRGTYSVIFPGQPVGTTDGETVAGTLGGTPSVRSTPDRIDGIDLTGATRLSSENLFYEVPGPAPDLISQLTHSPGGGIIPGSSNLFFRMALGNIGPVASSGPVTVTTTLPADLSALSLETVEPGYDCAIAPDASTVTCTTDAVIAANATLETIAIFRAQVASTAAGSPRPVVRVSGGGEPDALAQNNADDDVLAIGTGASALTGSVWFDADQDGIRDAGEVGQPAWTAVIAQDGFELVRAVTDADGRYSVEGLTPSADLSVRFLDPNGRQIGGPVTNETGQAAASGAVSPGNPGGAVIERAQLSAISVGAGETIPGLSLPFSYTGVVYDSVLREAVSGATVTLTGPPAFDPSIHTFEGTASWTTASDGRYFARLTDDAPSGTYALEVTSRPDRFVPGPSLTIPACTATLDLSGGGPATVQSSAGPPPASAPVSSPDGCATTVAGLAAGVAGTQFFTTFASSGPPATLAGNNIPLDSLQPDA
ncbi:MAG: SdrD B-like domain-containing protein, partial [Pseudomonadota bacterium]